MITNVIDDVTIYGRHRGRPPLWGLEGGPGAAYILSYHLLRPY